MSAQTGFKPNSPVGALPTDMTDDQVRSLFPGVQKQVYLNTAAQSLLPLPVVEAISLMARRAAERGTDAHGLYESSISKTRELAARTIGARAEQIAFCASTSQGLAQIAEGFEWATGDEVVLCDLEYPSNAYAWARQQRKGVQLRWVRQQEGRVAVEDYVAQFTERTRVVAVSHVQFSSGLRTDLQALGAACRERGIFLVVDGIQSVGAIPVEVQEWGVGALVTESRKWLMGPAGVGFIFVADEWIERIQPIGVGTSTVTLPHDSMMDYVQRIDAAGALDVEGMLHRDARRFEAGFPNFIGIAGLGAALALREKIGPDRIHRHIAARVQQLVDGLELSGQPIYGPASESERAGIVAFSPSQTASTLVEKLKVQGVSVALRDGRVRAAPHLFNDREDIERLIALVRREV